VESNAHHDNLVPFNLFTVQCHYVSRFCIVHCETPSNVIESLGTFYQYMLLELLLAILPEEKDHFDRRKDTIVLPFGIN